MDKITYNEQLSILKHMHSKIINSAVDRDVSKGAEVLKELLNVKGNSQTILDPKLINEIINYFYTGMKIGEKVKDKRGLVRALVKIQHTQFHKKEAKAKEEEEKIPEELIPHKGPPIPIGAPSNIKGSQGQPKK